MRERKHKPINTDLIILACCDAVEVYKPDATHWLFAPEVKAKAGYVEMSGELARELSALIH